LDRLVDTDIVNLEGVGDNTMADLDVVRLLKLDDEFLLRQLRVFCMMLQRAMRIVYVIVVASSLWVMFLNNVWLLVVSWGWCIWRCV
jgi:hypothetical protein